MNSNRDSAATPRERDPKKVLFSWPEPVSLDPLTRALPGAEFSHCALEDPRILDAVSDAEIWIAGGPPVRPEMVRAAKTLGWIQMLGAGMPAFFFEPEFKDRRIMVTNAGGINVVNMAEHALALLLAFARGLPELARRQARCKWLDQTHHPALFELEGQVLGLLGYGNIGRAIAKRATALGMHVWAMRRTPQPRDEREIDRILAPEDLDELLAHADHVLLALPATPETNQVIGKAALTRMKKSAYIYNIGRGSAIDHRALIQSLEDGEIAGAGLDVTDPEPLPPHSPLWKMPNVIITGHLAGITPRFLERVLAFVADNLARYREGLPLMKVIDLDSGY